MQQTTIKVLRLKPGAELPRYMSAAAAGMDLAALIEQGELTLEPGARVLIATGLAIELEPGYEAQIRPRSGLAFRSGVTVLNTPGTIDCDYRGELKILLVNHGQARAIVRSGDRIAQLVVAPVAHAHLEEVEALSETVRGPGGYGHTGDQD